LRVPRGGCRSLAGDGAPGVQDARDRSIEGRGSVALRQMVD
jgi:hypothetical protein